MSKLSNNRLANLFVAKQSVLYPSLSVKKFNRTDTDWRFVANINGNSYLFILLPCDYPYPSIIKRWLITPGYTNENVLLLSSYFPPGTQAFLDKNNINFVDLSGNCRIKRSRGNSNNKQNVLIRISGKPNEYPQKTKAVDVFSPRSSRVIKALLNSYSKSILAVDLAKTTKVSPALVTKILQNLVEQGFVAMEKRKGVRVIEPDLLLDEWATRYSQKRKIIIGRYYLNFSPGKNLVKTTYNLLSAINPILTGTAGASLIAPFADVDLVEIYATSPPAKKENLIQVQRGENIRIYQPYDDQIMENPQNKKGISVVDNFQL